MNEENAGQLPPFVRALPQGGWQILLRVQPGAKKSEIMEESQGRLRLRIAAPAVENKANKELLDFIAKKLNIRPSRLELASGESSREKRLLVAADATPDWNGIIP